MSDTKHISMRIDADILARVDADAKRMRWSRNAALGTCVEFGLVDLEMERGPVGGKLNGKEKVAEAAAEKAGEIGRENRPAGIQSDRVGGKGGSVRAPKKGFEVGNNAEIATRVAHPENSIETDAVGTTGCKVTVSRPMAGRPAHAGNCTCFTCKPPKCGE